MARLVTKFKYIKPTRKMRPGGYAEYIAKREGVERIDESQRLLPVTQKQTDLIRRLIKDFPDSKKAFEYEDYLKNKTVGLASDFISRTIEDHADQCMNVKTYADYIATRPRAERFGSHGLFTDDGVPVQLSKVSAELNRHTGNVWTAIVSIRREDAERLGYDQGKRWRDMLRSQTQNFSEAFHIPMQNLKWFAAFHNESYHPHVHLIVYSSEPKEGFLSREGVETLRASFAKDIFAQDLHSLYVAQTEHRDALRAQSKAKIAEIISQINHDVYDNPEVEDMILRLAKRLADTSGKKVYGYLKAGDKGLVDAIVDKLAADNRISQLYDLWYEQREEILRTYTDTMPERIPLSENKEFKSIKNAVIQEALNLSLHRFSVEEPTEPDELTLSEPMPEESEDDVFPPTQDVVLQEPRQEEYQSPVESTELQSKSEPHIAPYQRRDAIDFNSYAFKLYQAAKELLNRDAEEYDPDRAVTLLTAAAEEGLSIAQYRLGKLFLLGTDVEQSIEDAVFWLGKAAEQENEWAQYLLGKTLLRGELVAQDSARAMELLEASYRQGNRYAAYILGKAYLDGRLLPQDVPAALERLFFSAQKEFAPAQYLYGKLLYRGELLPQDINTALLYLEAAVQGKNPYAAVLAAKIYLMDEAHKSIADAIRLFKLAAENGSDYAEYMLGKVYLFGHEVERDLRLALYWLEASAGHGNQYAAQLLHSYHTGRIWGCSLGALHLLQQLAQLFDNREQEQNRNLKLMKAERKLLRIIEEKRLAHGLKHG